MRPTDSKGPKRKRSPWFAFYPEDFDCGTRAMSLAGRGAYLALLCYQFSNGSIPADDRMICRIIGAFPDEWEEIKVEVLAKFDLLETGNLVNRRMEKEREEREEIREKRVEAIQKRWADRNKPDTSVSTKVSTSEHSHVDTSPSPSPSPSPSSCVESSKDDSPTRRGVAHHRPTLEQAKSAAPLVGVSPDDAEIWWHKREATDWMRATGGGGTVPVGRNWQADLKQWALGEAQRKADRPNGKPRKPIPAGADPTHYDEFGNLIPFAHRNIL